MKLIRPITVIMLLAILAGTAVATSASAVTVVPTRYIVEGSELTSAETVDGAIGVAQFNTLVSGAKILIECTANELVPGGNNSIEGEGKAHTEVAYQQCYLYTISNGKRELSTTCGVKEPITFTAVGLLIAGAGGILEGEGKHEFGTANTLLVEITIERIPGKTCLLAGTFEVKNSYVFSGGAEGERETTEHELIGRSTGSKLKFGTEPAAYFQDTTKLKLRSGKGWHAG